MSGSLIIEHPCPFQGPLIREILAGRKTVTRRPLTERTATINGPTCNRALWAQLDFSKAWVDPGPSPTGNPGPYLKVPTLDMEATHRVYPRWQVGDRVWARETFAVLTGNGHRLVYAADGEPRTGKDGAETVIGMRWTPSIHMKRPQSRIDLEITAVSIERVQSITRAEARAEGVRWQGIWGDSPSGIDARARFGMDIDHDVAAFALTWTDIYGAESWTRNDWVTRAAFKLLRPTPKAP